MSTPRPEYSKYSKIFWDNCRDNKLTIQQCRDCKKYIFDPKIACDNCLSENLDWVEISGKGKVYTFSLLTKEVAEPAFREEKMPIVVAVIKLEEGVQMCSNIVQCNPEKVYIDMPVEVVFEKLDDEFTLPKFKPASK